jgi:hypothetical protein
MIAAQPGSPAFWNINQAPTISITVTMMAKMMIGTIRATKNGQYGQESANSIIQVLGLIMNLFCIKVFINATTKIVLADFR